MLANRYQVIESSFTHTHTQHLDTSLVPEGLQQVIKSPLYL